MWLDLRGGLGCHWSRHAQYLMKLDVSFDLGPDDDFVAGVAVPMPRAACVIF